MAPNYAKIDLQPKIAWWAMDKRERYTRLKQLIAQMPDIAAGTADLAMQQWLAAAQATAIIPGNALDIVDETTLNNDTPLIRYARTRDDHDRRLTAAARIQSILLRRLARLELEVEPAASGAFIAAGSSFDAFAAVSKVFAEAKAELLIVDPYLDAKVLETFAPGAPEGVRLLLLADGASVKATFKPAVEEWTKQYTTRRPVEGRISAPKALHDRVIVADRVRAWSLTQSFNHFAERSPASIIEVGDITALKIAAYEAIWASASPLA